MKLTWKRFKLHSSSLEITLLTVLNLTELTLAEELVDFFNIKVLVVRHCSTVFCVLWYVKIDNKQTINIIYA